MRKINPDLLLFGGLVAVFLFAIFREDRTSGGAFGAGLWYLLMLVSGVIVAALLVRKF